MDSNAIENISVSKLKMVLMLNDYLSPFINEGDKEPSWDGNIYLYNKKGKKKKDIKGRVSIQVKGEEKSITKKSEIKYPVSVVDLRNYLSDGGVIYFVVYVDKQGNSKIYYCTMEPLRIQDFLKELKRESQKTKSIAFRALPDDKEKVRDIFFTFQLNSQKQISFVNTKPLSFEDVQKKYGKDGFEISFHGYGLKDISDFQEFKKYNNTYLYVNVPDLDISIPMDGHVSDIFSYEEANISVGVSGKIYYEKVIRELHGKNEVILQLSKWMKIIFNVSKVQFKVEITSSPFIKSAVRDLSFFLNALKDENVELNGTPIKIIESTKNIQGFNYKYEEKRLKIFKDVVKLMDLFGIDGDIDLTKMSDEEKNNLDMLTAALINKNLIRGLKNNLEILQLVKIENHKFACVFQKVDKKQGTYKIFDIFDFPLFLQFEYEDGLICPLPIITLLDSQNLTEITNIQFEKMLPSFQKVVLNRCVLDNANHFALKLIGAADIVDNTNPDKKNKFLTTAQSFINWIHSVDEDSHYFTKEILFLNKFQINKRLKGLKKQELQEILRIAENIEMDTTFRFASYVLLENKIGADIQLELLLEKDKEELMSYPIWHLYTMLK